MDLAKRRGFIWGPSPNIYQGGVSGFYDWGPLGKLLKNKVESLIRKGFSEQSFWEVECPVIMPRAVWEASGHLEGFVDLIAKCHKCDSVYRSDTLIKEQLPKLNIEGFSFDQLREILEKKKIKCPKCKNELTIAEPYNLMMQTTIGLNQEAYLRPETATTTYLLFPEYFRFFRTKLPFGVFQIGKAFRNEISPRQGVFRTREFTQAEAQLFILKENFNNFEKYEEFKLEKLPLMKEKSKNIKLITLDQAIKNKIIKTKSYGYLIALAYKIVKDLGFSEKDIRIRQHSKEELAHYAEDAWDIDVKTKNFGWFEICGIHNRKDYDLKRHEEFSKQNFKVQEEIPTILEIAFGLERPTYCLLENAFVTDKVRDWLNFPVGMAPIDIAIFPLVKVDKELVKISKELFHKLDKEFICIYDENGSIGRRYRRMDEIGTTLCITIDGQTLKDNTATIREISTMKQIRVNVNDMADITRKILNNEIKFEKAGELI